MQAKGAEGMSQKVSTGGKKSSQGDAISVRLESDVDFEVTAAIATQAFASTKKQFSADHLRWLYQQCFSHGTSVVSAFVKDKKVGQVALLHQQLTLNGTTTNAVLLADLIVLPQYRSRQILTDLFAEVLKECDRKKVRLLLGMPNKTARGINDHFLSMRPFLKLDIRAGIGLPFRHIGDFTSKAVTDIARDDATQLFARYELAPANAMHWTPEALYDRTTAPQQNYAAHYTDELLLISVLKKRRGRQFVLLCGYFAKHGSTPTAQQINQSARAACRFHKHAMFIYVGHNDLLPAKPGIHVPDLLRPSPMTLDLRDLTQGDAIHLSRYQGVDFDFA